MIEIFKTNVRYIKYASKVVAKIRFHFPELQVNFDLKDCDYILRVEGSSVEENRIKKIVIAEGYLCETLV